MHHDDVECGSSEVNIGGNCTSYDISGGHVISATVNTNDNSVIINIHADDDGIIDNQSFNINTKRYLYGIS